MIRMHSFSQIKARVSLHDRTKKQRNVIIQIDCLRGKL